MVFFLPYTSLWFWGMMRDEVAGVRCKSLSPLKCLGCLPFLEREEEGGGEDQQQEDVGGVYVSRSLTCLGVG